DRGLLVVGLLVRKTGAELIVWAVLDSEFGRFAQQTLGRNLDQLVGDLADATLHARLARLPGSAAQSIELDAGFLRALARQEFDVLDRQDQLVATGVVNLQAVVRRARGLDRRQAHEAADAVIDVHNEVAGRQARHLGDEVFRPPRHPTRAHQAIAE